MRTSTRTPEAPAKVCPGFSMFEGQKFDIYVSGLSMFQATFAIGLSGFSMFERSRSIEILNVPVL
jgi:hypothetical protein